MAMSGPAAHAAVEYLQALPSNQAIYLDGQQIQMEAYAINGNNYVKLRDIGEAVGFNVYWDGAVQIDSDSPYTGAAPQTTQNAAAAQPKAGYSQAERMPEPKVGDKITCSDGYVYEITDVSKYQNSMFASEETGALPEPTCDWSLLDQPEMPAPEARHFTSGGKEYMFVRNLYETRRMQYTLYNAIGDDPQTWRDGKPVTRADGKPLVTVNLTIPKDVNAYSFWPWRSSQITNLFHSCPPGEYSLEAWDVYCEGAFRYTEYYIHVK
ncbi:MAG: hypothetical protein IJB17_02850 [Oscillospiraceae bacterium]|nr:hypothetical protein [Oscillospiraceae bacterium]MBQ4600551.1 hypothetical protein [Oscillospiraceae bacterium]